MNNSHESAEQRVNNNKNHPFSSLGRQSSIYSLTLDEFQHTLCENSGKNFGSMNMDEFLISIWNAEENQAATISETSSNIRKQQQSRSLTIPAPLCRKTVDEVWSKIHKGGHQPQSHQPTFGEMSLEDFLVKAGVVREPCTANNAATYGYGMYPNNNTNLPVGPSFRPVMGIAAGGGNVVGPQQPTYQGGRGVGYGTYMGIGGQYGMEMGLLRGRKRGLDGSPVEKVVERRQRRMIKNRESAARSRARKQAYTIELEAELNQLKQENAQFKLALCLEEGNERVHANGQKVKSKSSSLRRNLSF